MKPMFGTDLTADRHNETPNGKEFLVAEPSEALRQAYDGALAQATGLLERAKLPTALRVIQWICGFGAAVIAASIFRAVAGNADITFAQAYRNIPSVFWIGLGCLVVWAVLALLSKRKSARTLNQEDVAPTISNLESASNRIFADLAVPDHAQAVDVLTFRYKMKKDVPKPIVKGMDVTAYHNAEFRLFADSQNLYLVNLDGKYAIPRAAIRRIRLVKRSVSVTEWNKNIGYNEGIYAQYKMTCDNYSRILMKNYYILELEQNGQSWGIYFPNYELATYESITGKKAEG